MSYKKYLNDKSQKNELKTSKSRLFFISLDRVDIIAEARIFFLILLGCYSFYIIPPCYASIPVLYGDWGGWWFKDSVL